MHNLFLAFVSVDDKTHLNSKNDTIFQIKVLEFVNFFCSFQTLTTCVLNEAFFTCCCEGKLNIAKIIINYKSCNGCVEMGHENEKCFYKLLDKI
jgi:hypothetical protein